MPPAQTVLREILSKTLPATVTVDGEVIDVDLVWAQEIREKVPMPSWLLDFMPAVDMTQVLDVYEDSDAVTQLVEGETHVYDGEDLMVLSEMDVAVVSSVTGTSGGQPYTFIDGTDYTVVDSDRDAALDALSWKEGGTRPDSDTTVTVTYTHRLLERSRVRLYRQAVVVHLVARPLKVNDQAAGKPAQALRAQEVIEAMVDRLVDWYEATLRPALEDVGMAPGLELAIGQPFRLDGSAHLQTEATFTVDWQKDIILDRAPYVRKITTTFTVNQ